MGLRATHWAPVHKFSKPCLVSLPVGSRAVQRQTQVGCLGKAASFRAARTRGGLVTSTGSRTMQGVHPSFSSARVPTTPPLGVDWEGHLVQRVRPLWEALGLLSPFPDRSRQNHASFRGTGERDRAAILRQARARGCHSALCHQPEKWQPGQARTLGAGALLRITSQPGEPG